MEGSSNGMDSIQQVGEQCIDTFCTGMDTLNHISGVQILKRMDGAGFFLD